MKIALIVHSKYSCLFTMLLPVVENINIINSNIRKPVFPNWKGNYCYKDCLKFFFHHFPCFMGHPFYWPLKIPLITSIIRNQDNTSHHSLCTSVFLFPCSSFMESFPHGPCVEFPRILLIVKAMCLFSPFCKNLRVTVCHTEPGLAQSVEYLTAEW